MFQLLDFPPIDCKYKEVNNILYIFDRIRKKYVFLSPEEWVRQHLIHYLVDAKNYPQSLIKIESGLRYNKLLKRSDVLVFDRSGHPLIIIECKAANHKFGQPDLRQVSAYGSSLKPAFLGLTNGLHHFFWRMDYQLKTTVKIPGFPSYNQLIGN